MSYSTKNYTEQGGSKTVISGELEIKEGAVVTGLSSIEATLATKTSIGGIKANAKTTSDTVPAKIGTDGFLYVPSYPLVPKAENQNISTATDISELILDFNALLEKLKACGLMESE